MGQTTSVVISQQCSLIVRHIGTRAGKGSYTFWIYQRKTRTVFCPDTLIALRHRIDTTNTNTIGRSLVMIDKVSKYYI